MNSRAKVYQYARPVKVAIVGGGFGGLCMAIKLREAGIEDFVLLEKAEQVGGTWRDNSYPGCACDVQSHMYSFSFEGNPDWSARYSGWKEIQDYILRTTEKHGIQEKTRFNAEVCGAHFDQDKALWTLDLKDGSQVVCQHWVLASGPLHVPQIPNFPGLDRFKGKVFHSSQWDHGYDLTGKKVVSVGTGASAIQYVPQIAPEVERLTVVQRTPGWIIPRDERTYSKLTKTLFRRFPLLRKLHRVRLYWSNESRVVPIFHPRLAGLLEKVVKQFIRFQVKDKETARKLTPSYTLGCKRIMISNRYYPTFNRDNVELFTEGVKEVRENSIVFTDGSEREMDCLILGTGFIVDPRIYMKDFPITGLEGRKLQDDWADASEALTWAWSVLETSSASRRSVSRPTRGGGGGSSAARGWMLAVRATRSPSASDGPARPVMSRSRSCLMTAYPGICWYAYGLYPCPAVGRYSSGGTAPGVALE